MIEVKSFRSASELPIARRQAARYAKSQSLASATLAMFVPVKLARVDLDTYAIGDLPRLLGNFCHIVDAALAEVADLMPPL